MRTGSPVGRVKKWGRREGIGDTANSPKQLGKAWLFTEE